MTKKTWKAKHIGRCNITLMQHIFRLVRETLAFPTKLAYRDSHLLHVRL